MFQQGEHVVCIDAVGTDYLIKDKEYTVIHVDKEDGHVTVELTLIVAWGGGTSDCARDWYNSNRFAHLDRNLKG